jgi:hypothetical protein
MDFEKEARARTVRELEAELLAWGAASPRSRAPRADWVRAWLLAAPVHLSAAPALAPAPALPPALAPLSRSPRSRSRSRSRRRPAPPPPPEEPSPPRHSPLRHSPRRLDFDDGSAAAVEAPSWKIAIVGLICCFVGLVALVRLAGSPIEIVSSPSAPMSKNLEEEFWNELKQAAVSLECEGKGDGWVKTPQNLSVPSWCVQDASGLKAKAKVGSVTLPFMCRLQIALFTLFREHTNWGKEEESLTRVFFFLIQVDWRCCLQCLR